MNYNTIIAFIDCQKDFINPDGKLYVKDAEKIKPTLKKLSQLAKDKDLFSIHTADYHYSNSKELSDTPDFINTFPPHCMANTEGCKFIEETNTELYTIHDFWDCSNSLYAMNFENYSNVKNLVIHKDDFDVFVGNPRTSLFLNKLNPTTVYVAGVVSQVCVNFAVIGFTKYIPNVYVILDAIKELPNIPLEPLVENWLKLGVKFTVLSYTGINSNPIVQILEKKNYPTNEIPLLSFLI